MSRTAVGAILILLMLAPTTEAHDRWDVNALRRAWKARPGRLAHGLALYDALREEKKMPEARRIFRAHIRKRPLSRNELFLAGLVLGGRRGLEEMRRAIGDDLLGLHSTHRRLRARVLRELLAVEVALESDADRMAETATALARETQSPEDYAQAGVHLERAGQLRKAEKAYEQALQDEGHGERPRNRLAMLYAARGMVAAATRVAAETARRYPASSAAHLHYGLLLAMGGNSRGSLAAFMQAEACAAGDATRLAAVGATYAQIERYDAAQELLERALEVDPRHETALLQLTLLHISQGRAKEATASVRRAARVLPDNPEVAYLGGVVAELRGRLSTAIAAYRRALKLDETNADYALSLAAVLIETKRWASAERTLREAARLAPRNPTPWMHLAIVRSVGRRDDVGARGALKEYVSRGGDDVAMLEWLSELSSGGR